MVGCQGLSEGPANQQPPAQKGSLGLSSSTLDFGNVVVGSTGTLNVTATNSGATAVTISSAVPAPADFALSGITFPLTVAAGQSVKLSIIFTPAAAGSTTGTIVIASDASNASVSVSLSGMGVAPGQLSAQASIGFGTVLVGSSLTKSTTLTNSGGSSVTISQATVSGSAFRISGLTLPLTLNPGAGTTADVIFNPQLTGVQSGSIQLTTSPSMTAGVEQQTAKHSQARSAAASAAQTSDTVTISLSGLATTAALLSAVPTSVRFTNIVVGDTPSQSLTLVNSESSTVNISQVSVTGTGFSLNGLTLPLAVAAGQSATFSVAFSLPSAGNSSGNITITSDASNPTLNVPISGTAVSSSQSSQQTSVFFGIHQAHYEGCDKSPWDHPLFDVPAGTYRDFGACNTMWAQMNPAKDTFDFSGLDILLSGLSAHGVNDVFIVLGDTPNWISSKPDDQYCDQANLYDLPAGMCDPPSDLNANGTGTDQAWRSFVTALLQHVTASGYAATHAHIQMYEIWDEFQRSDTINNYTCGLPRTGVPTCSYRGTFAQMLRMTQDLRCIVEGHADDPITALKTTCEQDATMPARGLDPTALITEGDAGGEPLDLGNVVMQNYLYCNATPPAGSRCNYGSAGSASTDIISGHSYFVAGQVPELLMSYIAAEKAMLSPVDAAKPYITGEGSWGRNVTSTGDPMVADPGLQAGFLTRWYLALLMSGVNRGYWYAWDESEDPYGAGGLWSPTSIEFPPLGCTIPNATIGGFDCTGGIAYQQTVNWLFGATVGDFTCPTSCSKPTAGIFSFNLTRAGGYQAQILWDSTATSSCTNPQCGSTPPPALPFTAVQWRDVAGNTHTGEPLSIGASPVIVENMPPPGL